MLGNSIRIIRRSGFRGLAKGIYFWLYKYLKRFGRFLFPHLPYVLDDTYVLEDNSQVTLFTGQAHLFPDYQPRQQLDLVTESASLDISLISTCRNEGDNAAKWVARLAKQTLKPKEVIVVDAGSTDKTVETLEAAAKDHGLSLKVLQHPNTNIAEARNIAIKTANSSVIASLDFGCVPHDDWLEKLTFPFRIDSKMEVVAGWYHAVDRQGKMSRFPGWPALENMKPQDFIPSSRSLAFTKDAWTKAGGYPEWLTLTGEDTYFALELKRFCAHWAFVPDAVVEWEVPLTWMQFWRKAFYWSVGNGETGYNAWLYRMALRKIVLGALTSLGGFLILGWMLWQGNPIIRWLGFGVLLCGLIGTTLLSLRKTNDLFFIPGMVGLRIAQTWGFLRGAGQKAKVSLRRLKQTKGIFLILARNPIDDAGGGTRSVQLALELLRQGYWVVYINGCEKKEGQESNIVIAHPNLFLIESNRFNWDDFSKQYDSLVTGSPKFVLVDFPSADFLPLITKLKQSDGKIIYELVDDWSTSSGNSWYSRDVERQIVDASHFLIGVSPRLRDRLAEISRRRVELLPNAANSRQFNPERFYPRPVDLPDAEWIAIYTGSLWNDWVDWDLLRSLALHYPEAAIVVFGEDRDQSEETPDNLKFLGIKPQSILPSYLAHADVAFIPWKINTITQAMSPVQLYEYLAMHCPVIAPDLEHLRHIPGVHLVRDNDSFIRLMGEVRKEELPLDDIKTYLSGNHWQKRVQQILECLE
jgi:glycosyltransferase involved in cell wall biosynthesis